MREPADANLDELKKKARRRLVGAIVLALAAAVFVPMLLESDERPLGDDVSVRIPPLDQGKFVNRLNSPQPASANKTPAATAAPKSPAPLPRSDAAPASTDDAVAGNKDGSPAPASSPAPAVASLPAAASPPAVASPTVNAPSPAAATASGNEDVAVATSTSGTDEHATKSATPATKSNVAPRSASAASADTRTANAAPVPAKNVASAPAAKSAAHGGFVVQLAAFADDKGANALANRLKRSGHPAFTEPVSTSRGTLWRVRVGPYTSRDEASAARDKLKREGQSGIVAARTS